MEITRSKIILATVSCAALLITGLLIYGKRALIGGPEYTLSQLRFALSERDASTVREYVDFNELSMDVARHVISVLDFSNPFGDIGKKAAEAAVEMNIERVAKMAESHATRGIERGSFIEESKARSGREADSSSIPARYLWVQIDQCSPSGIVYQKKEGKVRRVGLRCSLPRYGKEEILEILFRNNGDIWRVAGLTNLSDFIESVDSLEAERTKRMNDKGVHAIVKYDSSWRMAGLNRWLYLTADIENIGEERIDNCALLFIFSSEERGVIAEYTVRGEVTLDPGQRRTLTRNINLDTFRNFKHIALWQTANEGELRLHTEMESLKLFGGDTIRLHRDWADIL